MSQYLCGYAKPRQSDLEIKNLHLHQTQAIYYLHSTYLPVWLLVLGSYQERCTHD